jgi:hypothetical protein
MWFDNVLYRTGLNQGMLNASRQCFGSGMFNPDTGSNFFHPASRVDKIPGPDPHQRMMYFLTQKTDIKFSKTRSGMFIPDPGFGFFPIPDTGFKKAPDPDPQHCFTDVL